MTEKGEAILISKNIYWYTLKYILKQKNVTRSKKGHFMMIIGTIYQEDIMISIYAHNNRAQTTWSKNWLKGEIDN